ncbi:MAG: hypothetical protein AB7F22_07780 [Reyranella sp.]|uniref:putative PDDEXK endonuclease n=1 Tax=Reyranella sp. TaxID=1929291 RepID=UPI003D0FE46E
MKNSRAKGKAGELELAKKLRERGYGARRGQQFKGGADSPDVVGLPGFHIEAKRVEGKTKGVYAWLAQAISDASEGATPVVMHRANGEEWVAILRLDDFLNLLWTGE